MIVSFCSIMSIISSSIVKYPSFYVFLLLLVFARKYMDKKMNFKVSVIIPTYGRPDNLKRAIDSVIEQTYKNIEIIVIDDNGINSKKGHETSTLVRHYPHIIYIKLEKTQVGGWQEIKELNEHLGIILPF